MIERNRKCIQPIVLTPALSSRIQFFGINSISFAIRRPIVAKSRSERRKKEKLVLSLRAERILRRRRDFFPIFVPPFPFPPLVHRPLSRRWRSFGLRTRAPSSVNQFPAPYTSPSRIARRDSRRESVRLIKSRRL